MENIKKAHLTLGTVQFGMEYGINNTSGKPTMEDSIKMLSYAYSNGIDTFDTAFAYGDAEEILGEFISANSLENKVNIISKLKPNILDEQSGSVSDIVYKETQKSLHRLKIKTLSGYLLHTPGYIYNDEIISSMQLVKNECLVKNIGVSIYEETDAIYAANLGVFDYIQIPYAIFDQRLNKTDFFSITKKNNIKIFSRNTFLQGLIFMEERCIPERLSEAKQYMNDFDKIIQKHNASRLEAAMAFSIYNKNIDYVVFGVDNIKQLKEDIDTAYNKKDYSNLVDELTDAFINVSKSIIFPSLWAKN